MATTIRLARHGAKKRPFYRIVVADSRAPRDGRRLDQIGYYDPRSNAEGIYIDESKLQRWLERGAQLSLTVTQLVKRFRQAHGSIGAKTDPAPEHGEAES